MFCLDFPQGFALVGSSPEVHVKCMNGRIDIRPIAGTRWRGKTAEEDDSLAQELLNDPKERAEHIMLVDLARNDVGRVADYGTVRVSDLMIIERYSHVMHIVSNVDGHLRDDKTAYDVMRATFPAGTVSGRPKCAPWRSSTSARRANAVPMPVRWATLVSTATSTPASLCAPAW
jgi:anthranilate synthase component 1